MDEILALQRELAAAQETSSLSRLSERNCVELVMKLQELSLVDLIFSRTGKEYLTPQQVEREILDEIYIRGGRVNVIELPDALNIDLIHIEAALPKIIAESQSPTRIVNGEIVTDDYLASLADEIDLFLDQSPTGIDDLAHIASRTGLPVKIIRSCVLSHVGSKIGATLDQSTGVLTSHRARASARASAIGALRAVSCPLWLSDLTDFHGIPASVVSETARELLEHGVIKGRLEGHGNRMRFIPAVYEAASVNMAKSLFANNGFLTLEQLRSLSISDVHGFCRQRIAEAKIVRDIVIGPTFLETLHGSAAEAVENGSWLNLLAVVPAQFPADCLGDVLSLVTVTEGVKRGRKETVSSRAPSASKRKLLKEKSAAVNSGESAASSTLQQAFQGKRFGDLDGYVLRDQFFLSRELCGRCYDLLESDAKNRALRRAEKLLQMLAVVGNSSVSLQSQTAITATEGTGAARAQKARSRRRRDRTGNDKASTSNNSTSTAHALPVDVPCLDEMYETVMKDESFATSVAIDFMGNDNADTAELFSAIVDDVLGGCEVLQLMYGKHAEQAVVQLEKDVATRKLQSERKLLDELETAEVYYNNAETLEKVSPSLVDSSRQLVTREVCGLTALRILELIGNSVGIVSRKSEAEGVGRDRKQLTAAINDTVQLLPPDVVSKTCEIVRSVVGKSDADAMAFIEAYDEITTTFDLPARRALDKKRERARNAVLRAELEDAIDDIDHSSISPSEILSACAVLVHAKCSGGAIVYISYAETLELCDFLQNEAKPESIREALGTLRSVTEHAQDRAEPHADHMQSRQELVDRLSVMKSLLVKNSS